MKYFVSSVFFFLLLIGCSDSETTPEIPEEEVSLPTITTVVVTDVTDVSALSGGNVTDDGGAAITDRGVVWGTSTGPTISDNKIANGTGKGEFNSSLEDLEANLTYYVRAYAINSAGTAYGNELSFNTLEPEPVAKVFEGDVILTSQQEVDDFGAESYTRVSGKVIVKDSNTPSTIFDLTPLWSINSITGSLYIEQNNILNKLEGFDRLKTIGGDLIISSNNDLEAINAYKELELIDGRLLINKVGGAIDGFTKLKSIGSGFTMQFVNGIEDLNFFESLVSIDGFIEIIFNQQLRSLSGFDKLNTLSKLKLWGNGSLLSLAGLNGITTINEGLIIQSNGALESLTGLETLENVQGSVEIYYNGLLKSLNGLKNLKSIGSGLEIINNDLLESLEGLGNLETTGANDDCLACQGSIIIESNPRLLNIDALENLTTAWYAYIEIKFNAKLQNLDGLRNLTNIYKFQSDTGGFGATIESNSVLNDVCGIKNVYESNPFRFYVQGNLNGTENPEGSARDLLSMCD